LAPAVSAAQDKADSQAAKSKHHKHNGEKKSSHKSSHKSAKAKGTKEKKSEAQPSGGFGGVAWGQSTSSFPGLVLQEDNGPSKYYSLPGGDMAMYGVQMREMVYIFCHDAFAGVMGRFDGDLTRLELLAKLRNDLGEPLESPANYLGDRSWRFPDKDSVVMLEYAGNASTGAVAYFSPEVFTPCSQGAP
jgi:hypothetical protein